MSINDPIRNPGNHIAVSAYAQDNGQIWDVRFSGPVPTPTDFTRIAAYQFAEALKAVCADPIVVATKALAIILRAQDIGSGSEEKLLHAVEIFLE